MAQKAAAAAIVGAIGVIASVVLYSPIRTGGPLPPAPSLVLSDPLAPTREPPSMPGPASVEAPPTQVARGPSLRAAALPLVAVIDSPPEVEPAVASARFPVAFRPEPIDATPILAVAALPSASGRLPAPGAEAPSRNVMKVAGQSIGTAFAVTGRSLRTAFKRAF